MSVPQMEESLLSIKVRLSNLRQDRTKFLTPAHVAALYAEFGEQVKGRSTKELDAAQSLLQEVVLMFSLALITVGHTNYVASTYAITVTMETILNYLSKDPSLTPKELDVLASSLATVISVASEDGTVPRNPDDAEICDIPAVDLIIRNKLSKMQEMYTSAEAFLAELKEDEWPLYIQVVRLRRDILCCAAAREFSAERIAFLGEKCIKVEALIKHAGAQEQSEPLLLQIQNCYKFYEWYRKGVTPEDWSREAEPKLEETYKSLQEAMSTLEVFVMTRRWTLRGTDLYQHVKQLMSLTPWLVRQTEQGSSTERLWFLCYYMARRCWTLIFKLLNNSEPVSEALSSVYNQVVTMKRCLTEVQQAGGINNLRELYPYQMRLASLDDLRTDGKFTVDGDVPPGQGILNGMLAECYDLMYELKVELEEKIDQGEVTEEDSLVQGDENEADNSSSDVEDWPTESKSMSLLSTEDDASETPALTPSLTPS